MMSFWNPSSAAVASSTTGGSVTSPFCHGGGDVLPQATVPMEGGAPPLVPKGGGVPSTHTVPMGGDVPPPVPMGTGVPSHVPVPMMGDFVFYPLFLYVTLEHTLRTTHCTSSSLPGLTDNVSDIPSGLNSR
jgi:hypothetical protein